MKIRDENYYLTQESNDIAYDVISLFNANFQMTKNKSDADQANLMINVFAKVTSLFIYNKKIKPESINKMATCFIQATKFYLDERLK